MNDVKRFAGNPIITTKDVPFRVNSIFNAGAIKIGNEYLLLCRVEMPSGRSSFLVARSPDGIKFTLEDQPCLTPEDHEDWFSYVEWGIEDPRITFIDNRYYILYTGYSRFEPTVMLARTDDFHTYEIMGTVTEPSNKDAVLFPDKIDHLYWKIDRPSGKHRRDLWISQSPDLIHWGQYRFLMEGANGSWEQNKIGASTPPLKTKKGWLMIYHGVRGFDINSIYRQGVMLLDLEKPWQVLAKSKVPFLSPEMDYERTGDVPNVVFTTGWIREQNGDIKIYYSGADMNICLAQTSEEYLLSLCEEI
jgi:predicted GH43/DUF377 family glycosyl hydrolase